MLTSMLVRARIVLPISTPPIEDGAVLVQGTRIAWIGPWAEAPRQIGTEIVDLREVILLPGLINAHCHLDYTGFAGQIPPPRSFTGWIQSLVALKRTWTLEEFRKSWLLGAEMLLRSGTTTVGDVEAVPELLPEVWSKTPLCVISFREIVHLTR